MQYELYFLNKDGRVTSPTDLKCVDELGARATVSGHANGQAMELCCGSRQVRKYRAGWSSDALSAAIPWRHLHVLTASAHLEEGHTESVVVLDDSVAGLDGAVLSLRNDGRLELLTEGLVVVEPVDPVAMDLVD